MLTQEYLKSILNYNPETGIFTWIKSRQKISVGDNAGNIDFHGYMRIKIDQIEYKAHILAWFYMKGIWPEKQIDHEDTIKHNNIWTNLREASESQNQANKNKYSNNKSGIKGVSWSEERQLWLAQIRINKKTINLGRYKLKEDAAKAYEEAAKKYHGEFARF